MPRRKKDSQSVLKSQSSNPKDEQENTLNSNLSNISQTISLISNSTNSKLTKPKIEKARSILKYAKVLQSLIILFQTEELLKSNNKVKKTYKKSKTSNNMIIEDDDEQNTISGSFTFGTSNNNNSISEINNKINKLNCYDEKAKIDYTGINKLMNTESETSKTTEQVNKVMISQDFE